MSHPVPLVCETVPREHRVPALPMAQGAVWVIMHLPSSRRVLASKFRDVLQPLKTVTNDFYRTLPLAGYDVVTRTAVLTSVAQAADEMVHSDAEIVEGAQCITQKRPDNWVRNGEKVRELRLSPERLSPSTRTSDPKPQTVDVSPRTSDPKPYPDPEPQA